MGSTRLPGKVLLPLNGHRVIDEVLLRCKMIGLDEVICAISLTGDNDPLADYAAKICRISRGPEEDVLARYLIAAAEARADYIMRVTADCPLINPDLCRLVMDTLISSGADYVCNNLPRTYAHGLDCEAFTMRTLRKAHKRAKPNQREHVTTWMRESPSIRKINISAPEVSHERVTLDTQADYDRITAIFNQRVRPSGPVPSSISYFGGPAGGGMHQPHRHALMARAR